MIVMTASPQAEQGQDSHDDHDQPDEIDDAAHGKLLLWGALRNVVATRARNGMPTNVPSNGKVPMIWNDCRFFPFPHAAVVNGSC
jgi:hypothetical protein